MRRWKNIPGVKITTDCGSRLQKFGGTAVSSVICADVSNINGKNGGLLGARKP